LQPFNFGLVTVRWLDCAMQSRSGLTVELVSRIGYPDLEQVNKFSVLSTCSTTVCAPSPSDRLLEPSCSSIELQFAYSVFFKLQYRLTSPVTTLYSMLKTFMSPQGAGAFALLHVGVLNMSSPCSTTPQRCAARPFLTVTRAQVTTLHTAFETFMSLQCARPLLPDSTPRLRYH